MKRRRLLPAIGLVVIALATAVGIVLVSTIGDGDGDDAAGVATVPDDVEVTGPGPRSGLPEAGIGAVGVIQPRIILFGDTIRARVDVFLDRRKVDPASVRVSTEFVPWENAGPQARVRSDSGQNTYLRTTFTLRCTSSPCLPANESSALEFTPARVSYAPAGESPGTRESVRVDFPILLVYSRFAAANAEGPAPSSSIPVRADLDSFSAVSYRISPSVIIPVALVLAALLGVAGIALAWIAVPRRSHVPEPEPEPEPEPVIVLTPLEQALELLDGASRADGADGAEERRRALELVAEVLDLEHPDLARSARTLAWSEDDPLVEQTSGLATRVRTTIDSHGNGNGRVR